MELKIIYEDEKIRALNKPAGINSDDIPLRAHRLDKETSGVLLVAKDESSLEFLQKQFENREVEKRYIALVLGTVKKDSETINLPVDRSKKDWKKQKVFLPHEPEAQNKRQATTEYQVKKRFKDYTLLEVFPKTGRKHQIRAHLAYLGHPIAGDKLYGFKNQSAPKGLTRQFLHASYLKIRLPSGKTKEFEAELPNELKTILKELN